MTELGKLAAALAAAQGEIESAPKSTLNTFFGNRYANLTEVWGACRAALSKHKIAVIQAIQCCDANVWLETTLVHESGEHIISRFPLKPSKFDMQGYGSAISYARRYSLAAMVGVVSEEDDDGNQASGRGPNQVQAKKTVAAPLSSAQTQTQAEGRPDSSSGYPPPSPGGFNPNIPEHVSALMAICTKQGVTGKWLNNVITSMRGKPQSELEGVINSANPEGPDSESIP